ncbi:hypothetical protein PF010_g8533 [Phytophthora fragariae]|uniref:Uncharacterized protein n=1 Tax=Phytophthora fragariae TaxID=53985 RepID=A0A6A3U761_9STRA|nr:hypothetical protein PF007_g9630 [Phytophthora fragariae]KAE9117653.1 hypothetical protein PF010_g8533 [Phytophthora fragariae]KAE9146447.1 hypothetical protein PF006_g8802 [Phytophthora fragariae]KAE9238388.1 hypothetical protein PF002_g10651 [Phytophthora fragariae]KAE9345256.1 hypothetical protein PF008_g8849 [Phytophthora fragariae]
MEKQAQSDKFQEAMQQLVGQHLIDSIRTQLKQVGGVWDASKDQPRRQAKSLRSLLNSTKNSKALERGRTPQGALCQEHNQRPDSCCQDPGGYENFASYPNEYEADQGQNSGEEGSGEERCPCQELHPDQQRHAYGS